MIQYCWELEPDPTLPFLSSHICFYHVSFTEVTLKYGDFSDFFFFFLQKELISCKA